MLSSFHAMIDVTSGEFPAFISTSFAFVSPRKSALSTLITSFSSGSACMVTSESLPSAWEEISRDILQLVQNLAGKKEFSSVAVAGFVAFGVTTGAILLNSGVLLSEQALEGSPQAGGGSALPGGLASNALTDAVLDDKTRLLLNAALVFLGLGAILIGKSAFLC